MGAEPGEGARAPKGDGEGARPVRARLGLQFDASSSGAGSRCGHTKKKIKKENRSKCYLCKQW